MHPDLRLVVRLQEIDNRLGDLAREIATLPKHIAEIEKRLISHERKLEADRAALSVNQKASGELETERATVVAGMMKATYQLYERVRKPRKGIGVAEAVDGRCSACNMSMRLQFFQDLKRSGQIMTCESCHRILYFNPSASIEGLPGESERITGAS